MIRASSSAVQLLEDYLRWDPEKRPTAQQSIKYPYFSAMKQRTSANIVSNGNVQLHQTQQSNNGIPSARISIVDVAQLDNSGVNSRISVNPDNGNNISLGNSNGSVYKTISNSDLNELNSMLSMSRLSQNPPLEKRSSLDNGKLNDSAKPNGKYKSGINYSVLNEMLNNYNLGLNGDINNDTKQSRLIRNNSITKSIADQSESGVNDNGSSVVSYSIIKPAVVKIDDKPTEVYFGRKEKVNDIFVARNIDSVTDANRAGNSDDSAYFNNGFFLHKPNGNSKSDFGKSVFNDSYLNDSKVYNAFSRQPVLMSRKTDEDIKVKKTKNPSLTRGLHGHFSRSWEPIKANSIEDELEEILGYVI